MASAKLRRDIEGLRAIAILSVLAFHSGLPLPGGFVGVDVFFVISGFLITGLLVREAEANGHISLTRFYARRARRLLPAATMLIGATLLAIAFLAPPLDRSVFGLDGAAAALYVSNWRLAARAVDYLAEDVGRSPFLHFWSLSVEEQFYLIWPLLMVCTLVLARRLAVNTRRALLVAIVAVVLPSLVWSCLAVQTSAREAFFDTSARLWELGVGALLAIARPGGGSWPAWVRNLPSVLGIGLIALSCFGFDARSAWPGPSALVPTLATALVIWGGALAPEGWISRVLGSGPMVWVGGLSYSVYLWHWPIVVAGQDWLGLEGIGPAALLSASSFVPAWLSYRWVEGPVRHSETLESKPALSVSLGANATLATALLAVLVFRAASPDPGATPTSGVRLEVAAGRVRAEPSFLGAGALGKNPEQAVTRALSPEGAVPSPQLATKDVPRAYPEGCQLKEPDTEIKWCEIGDPRAKRTAVVVGDSKILQYYEALDVAGQALGWKMVTATKSSCPFSDVMMTQDGKPYEECRIVNQAIMRHFDAQPPDAIITSQHARTGARIGDPERSRTAAAMTDGLRSRWESLAGREVKVVVVLDNPHPPEGVKVYECLVEHPDDASACAFSRSEGLARSATGVQRAAARGVEGVELVDLTDYICPGEHCPPVIGGVLIYRQGSHITNTYARTLTPILTQKLARALK